MRLFFSLVLAVGFLNGATAADETNRKPAIAGTYVGQVDGDQAKAVLKADGSIVEIGRAHV